MARCTTLGTRRVQARLLGPPPPSAQCMASLLPTASAPPALAAALSPSLHNGPLAPSATLPPACTPARDCATRPRPRRLPRPPARHRLL